MKDFLNERKAEIIEIPQPGSFGSTGIVEVMAGNETTTSNKPTYPYNAAAWKSQGPAEKPAMPGQRPEKPPIPTTGQPGSNEYATPPSKDNMGKGYNSGLFHAPPPGYPDPKNQPTALALSPKESSKGNPPQHPPPQATKSQSETIVIEDITDYDNYCIIVGIPSELTDRQVLASLKAQDIEQPVEYEWGEDGVTQYFRLGFKSDKAVKELILREINVGPTVDDIIYPVAVLPLMKDKKISDLLVYHLVQVESSIPVDSLFLHLFYSPYGPVADVVDMKPSKHVIIFTKQPHAQHVLSIPQISLQKNNIEVVMKHSMVDSYYPLVRKNLQSHLQTLATQYMNAMKPILLSSPELEVTAQQQQHEEYIPQSPPHYGPKGGYPVAKKFDKKGKNQPSYS